MLPITLDYFEQAIFAFRQVSKSNLCAIVPNFYNEMRAVSCFKSYDTYFSDTSTLVTALVAMI